MIKIKLHSVTDLITNSSTVIFTYSGGTIEPLKEMINEIFKTFGIDKTCDDMFDAVVLCRNDVYSDWIDNREGEYPEGVDENTDIDQLVADVAAGKISKPDWFTEVEEDEGWSGYFPPSTYLYLTAKDEKYVKIGNLIDAFLYSPDHEATRDG